MAQQQNFADGPIVLENMRILPAPFRNFEGRKSQYNRDMSRSFAISLPPEMMDEMEAAGLNVKRPAPDSEYPDGRIEVAVSNGPDVFSNVRIFLVDGNNTTRIDTTDQKQMAMLDTLNLSGVDLVLNPYHWEIDRGKGDVATGIKLYLRAAYLHLWHSDAEIDPFAKKYGVAVDLDDAE